MTWTGLLLASLWLAIAGTSASASFLDTYLNNMRIDQASPERASEQEERDLKAGSEFGQTFVAGPDAQKIAGIAIQSPHHNPEWGESVSLVLALYDSPAKARKLAEFEMEYEWRAWEDMTIVFPVDVEAQPGRIYYYELTSKGGNGRIGKVMTASADYTGGQAYVDGKPQEFDFAFQTYVHTRWDRDRAYQDAFRMFDLDYPGMEAVKAAVAQRKWDDAAKALVAHFESRPAFRTVAEEPKGRTIPDLTLADLAADMKVRDADGNIQSLGPNWNHLRWWPTRGGVGLTREGIRKYLAAGYSSTRDRKYAVAWNSMLKAFFTDLPSPTKSGIVPPGANDIPPIFPGGLAGGSMWAGLSIGARLAHEFYYYAVFADSPEFTWDVRAAFIFNLGDMADVLAIQKAGGNWTTQMFDHLFYFSTEFPEYARSKEYAKLAFEGLQANMRETLQPDGPIGESAGYQMMVHNQYLDVMERARMLGLAIPEDLTAKVEAALAFHMYTVQPDGLRPAFGDALGDDARPLLKRGAKEFGRKDMLWVATGGADGSQPQHLSVGFPHSGYYVMRSDWTPEARYLVLRNGRYTAHGHFDALSFVMHAYGSALIVDPGIYIYGTPDAVRLISTKSHSTISVDGADLENGGGETLFIPGRSVDYLCAKGPAYQKMDRAIRAVRRLAFLRPDYWVLSDMVYGTGTHQVDSRFHFPDTRASLDTRTHVARSTRESGGNIALIPAETTEFTSSLEDADTAYVHEKLEPALMLRRSAKVELPLRMDTVAYPFTGDAPDASVSALTPSPESDIETSGIRITTRSVSDTVIFAAGPESEAFFADAALRLNGQFACIRKTRDGTVRGFAWAKAKRLDDGPVLAECENHVKSLDVTYEGDLVRITAAGAEPSLKIAALGRTRVSINGSEPTEIRAANGFFRPFSESAR